jgi:hypothetical protein
MPDGSRSRRSSGSLQEGGRTSLPHRGSGPVAFNRSSTSAPSLSRAVAADEDLGTRRGLRPPGRARSSLDFPQPTVGLLAEAPGCRPALGLRRVIEQEGRRGPALRAAHEPAGPRHPPRRRGSPLSGVWGFGPTPVGCRMEERPAAADTPGNDPGFGRGLVAWMSWYQDDSRGSEARCRCHASRPRRAEPGACDENTCEPTTSNLRNASAWAVSVRLAPRRRRAMAYARARWERAHAWTQYGDDGVRAHLGRCSGYLARGEHNADGRPDQLTRPST